MVQWETSVAHSYCSSNANFSRCLVLLSIAVGALGFQDTSHVIHGASFRAAASNLFSELPHVHFIRIQKTASTTFGENIMPRFCGRESNDCRFFRHLDYSQARMGGANVSLVTLLRDPVERTLSEFFFMRAKQGRGLVWQNQWDFRNSTWLNLVQGTADVDEALRIYLHDYPGSASRNRQALYLIGFKGRQQALGWPIDWDGRHSELLALAERHLEETVAFGFTDCFVTSVGAMARALGWDALKAMEMAGHIRARGQNKPSLRSVPAKIWLSTQLDENAAGPSEDWAVDRKWRDLVSENVVRQIEKLNSVDMELHEYASKRFRERFGETCT
mmetsp:Transcript_35468/g.82371  ORF Transcript_35468/g.82371 Transcript_35468/m.82371 type:complete len:331 (+) Transcript_35468:66-1058(+)|eukprot:CAMPEP_0171097624 /NCGR_PEP_ID=MMETSP0766_2-20121228/47655_1 /TAXON_ID=439317 /ORGANISM="Gambierdiscus australes, Strain CAWD 149" /LENGTH=330 /DNA_ID=CAMNT_0011556851 /DNA_START=52 /DNA_END=1044 /DNA_ORIENTATION=+